MEGRKVYAETIKFQRMDNKQVKTGFMRAKQFSTNWSKVSLKQQVNHLFGTAELEYKVGKSGKVLIYPKGSFGDRSIIVFDVSGDYFRVMEATVAKNGSVLERMEYLDLDGKAPVRPLLISKHSHKSF